MKRAFLGALLAMGSMILFTSSAQARYHGCSEYQCMSCYQLWYERNSIFAEEGYCFRTRRAIRVFGRRCYPPYGRLTPWERERVNEILYWERVKGCR